MKRNVGSPEKLLRIVLGSLALAGAAFLPKLRRSFGSLLRLRRGRRSSKAPG